MKKIIQLYTVPSVDKSILKQVLHTKKVSENQYLFLIHVFLGIALLIFIQHLLQLHISYFDVLIGIGGALNIYSLFLVNIVIGVIHFIFQHPLLIMSGCFSYYMMNLYVLYKMPS